MCEYLSDALSCLFKHSEGRERINVLQHFNVVLDVEAATANTNGLNRTQRAMDL